MSERILVPYDGSPCADEAVAKAMELAGAQGASLYLLAMAPGEMETAASLLPASARLMDDLITFARLGAKLGIDINGSYLDAPTESRLRAVIKNHHIDRVLMVRNGAGADTSGNGRLLNALVDDCPVPVTVLTKETFA